MSRIKEDVLAILEAHKQFLENKAKFTNRQVEDGTMAFDEYFKLSDRINSSIFSKLPGDLKKLLDNFDIANDMLRVFLLDLKLISS